MAKFWVDPVNGSDTPNIVNSSLPNVLWQTVGAAIQASGRVTAATGGHTIVCLKDNINFTPHYVPGAAYNSVGTAITGANVLNNLTIEGDEDGVILSAGLPLTEWTYDSYTGYIHTTLPAGMTFHRSLREQNMALPIARLYDNTRVDQWLVGTGIDRQLDRNSTTSTAWYVNPSDMPSTLSAGALIHISLPFSSQIYKVISYSYSSGIMFLDAPIPYGGYGIFEAVRECLFEILNDPCGMQIPGNWYFDPGLNRIYVKKKSSWNINTLVLWVSNMTTLFDLRNSTGITVKNISIADNNSTPITGLDFEPIIRVDGNGTTIQNVHTLCAGGMGFQIGDSNNIGTGVTVQGNDFASTGGQFFIALHTIVHLTVTTATLQGSGVQDVWDIKCRVMEIL